MQRLPRKRPIDYILPFLIIICAGVIVVLGYQLWSSLSTDSGEKDIFMYTAQGSSKILPWGSGEWERAYNGTRILQGDSIQTMSGAKIVIELFDEHFVRLDEKTEIVLSEVKKNGNAYEINLILMDGSIWLNSNDNAETPVKFTVKTNNTFIKTVGTVFQVEQQAGREIIRVIKGTIFADILIDENGKKVKAESLQIGIGQEAVLTSAELAMYARRESPPVIAALSDMFKESGFYKWNMAEDQMPSDFTKASLPSAFTDDIESEEGLPVFEGELAAPVITVPSSLNFETSESSITLRGTTSASTMKMMVDVKSGATSNTYDLNLYVPGNTEWSFSVSDEAGTMKTGLNEYSFYSLGEEDSSSRKATIYITYNKESSAETETEEEQEEEVVITDPLTVPTADTFNGSSSNTVTEDGVKVVGSVTGAAKILVDGYQLQAFKPGDKTWTYNVRESFGNLKEGENVYTVEAYGQDGSKKTGTFTIIYNKPAPAEAPAPVQDEPAETVPEDTTPSEEPAATPEPEEPAATPEPEEPEQPAQPVDPSAVPDPAT